MSPTRTCGIQLQLLGTGMGALREGARQHKFAHQELPRALVAQPARQPIQQFGMSRRCPQHTKVVGGADEAKPHHMVPDAVRSHAPGQRMLRINQFGG